MNSGTCGTPTISADPKLGALADNGGPTWTFGLLPGSPAIDAGEDATCETVDQRGITRPQGPHCDIGAFEYVDIIPPTVSSITLADPSPTSASSVGFTVTFSVPVTDVDLGDFTLDTATGNITDATIDSVNGSGDTYTVIANTGSGNGTLGLNVPVNATITDLAGDLLAGLPFIGSDIYTIEDPPTVFTFASMGDAEASDVFATTVDQIASLNPEFVILNGDLENDGVDSPEMDPMIADLKNAGLYNQTFLIRGNHDDMVPGSATLWESYFETAPNIKTLPEGVTDYVSIDSSSDYLTYSYIYGNSMFVGLDVPGDADLLTTRQINWLDSRLTYAESQGLTHAFIYFHGPMYCIESTHCNCPTRIDGSCTPSALVTVINRHPIISAFLHGHEHVLGWTHMDNTRLSGLTGSFEEFITSPAGGMNYASFVFPARMDYYYNTGEDTQGFATIGVNGNSFTYSIYEDGTTTPVWSKTFTKGTAAPVAPTVTTQAVTAIGSNTATGNGTITSLGIPNPTQYGVVWDTAIDPTIALATKTTQGVPAGTGAFTSSITGLSPNTLYYVRAYATNSQGTSYGADVTFTSLAVAPTVTTQAATNLAQTTATGNGTITSLGIPGPTQYGVVWNTAANPTVALTTKTAQGVPAGTGAFTSSITGLTPGTLYHVRAYATNTAGTSYGSDVTFTTIAAAPTVTTQAVTNIATTTAIGNGNITSLGGPNPTQYGVVWDTAINPTVALSTKTAQGAISVTGPFTSSITGLVEGALYHVRAYATNTAGTSYGEDVTFTTASSFTITTPATNARTGANVTGAGSVAWSNPGNITTVGAPYATVALTAQTSNYLEGSNYGFAIPANATINGIVLTIDRTGIQGSSNDIRDVTVRLMKAGVLSGSNKAVTGTDWPTSLAVATYGTNADIWGTTWTPADINNTNFGVALSVNSAGSSKTATVDYMQIAVTYTVSVMGTTTGVNCGAGTPSVAYGSSITCVATVVRNSGSYTPTGHVTWTTNSMGGFARSPCSLSGSNGTATCSVTYTPGSVGTGSHLITATYAGDSNFLTSSGSQAVTVNKKDASVTPDAMGKVLGEDDPALTGSMIGFMPDDNVTATYSRVVGETVEGSPYTISAVLSPAGVLGNYNITYNTGDFTITPPTGDFTLTVNTVGNGTVTQDPDKAAYQYGDIVTLIVTPDLGWSFGSWSANVVNGTVTIHDDTTVTATFTQDEYTLTIDKVGSGAVNPDQAAPYHLGDIVSLTPVPDQGWSFSEWSGACTGSAGCSVTMDSSKSVTATFTQDNYNLTIDKVGNGSVTKVPDQATYHYGDVVALTATPDAGWNFDSWSANVVEGSVTIHADTTVTATFTQGPQNTIYDDADAAWTYTGDWSSMASVGSYADTLHYSTTIGNEAQVSFTSRQIKLIYLASPISGSVGVYLDGVKVTSINQYSSFWDMQKTWTSDLLPAGNHTVLVVQESGSFTTLDGITVMTTPVILSTGIYDDANTAFSYVGRWFTLDGIVPDAYANTLRYSTTIGNETQVNFTGQQIKLTYLASPISGSVDVYVDGVKVTSLNQDSVYWEWQKTWTSDLLPAGDHSLRIVHASGDFTAIDAIEVVTTPVILSTGVYDDPNPAISYEGRWFNLDGLVPDAYSNTLRYSISTEESVQMNFNGRQFKLTYLVSPSSGVVDVYVDGVKVTTLDQYSANWEWQRTWMSDLLPAGNHSLRVVHANGGFTNIDAVEVVTTPAILSTGTYDDGNPAFSYAGRWQTMAGVTGPYADSLHYSIAIGASTQVDFNGRQIELAYLAAPTSGVVDVYLDGVKVATIDQYSDSWEWQKTWTSDVLSVGDHSLRVVYASGSESSFGSIDAVTVIP